MSRGETLPASEISDIKKESNTERLWRIYGFPGSAPKAGTVAEQRLMEACQAYIHIVMSDKGYSDNRRRELHNQIAVMVVGELRSGMAQRMAERVADFASELVQGFTLAEAEKYSHPEE